MDMPMPKKFTTDYYHSECSLTIMGIAYSLISFQIQLACRDL